MVNLTVNKTINEVPLEVNYNGTSTTLVVEKTINEVVLQVAPSQTDSVARASIEAHKNNTSNPHNVESTQLPDGQDLTLIFNNALL